MIRGTLIFIIVISGYNASSQSAYKGFPSLIWPKLYNIGFTTAKDEFGEYQKPVFSNAVKSLQGKTITLPGYIVPFDGTLKSSHFMFSSLPLNACFFCGVGGPETVVEVNAKNPVTYTDHPVEIKGVLRLNDSDPEKMIYILDHAEILGEIRLQ